MLSVNIFLIELAGIEQSPHMKKTKQKTYVYVQRFVFVGFFALVQGENVEL